MTGKVVIVTGGSAGIGYEIAKGLAKRRARVIIASRNEERGVMVAASLAKDTGNDDVIFKQLDLASLKSIRNFCQYIVNTEKHLHVLVNNAAGVCLGNQHTADGIVKEMQVNYFGTFLLTMLLLPMLKKSQPSRIVMLSSIAAYLGDFDAAKINRQKYYSDFKTYANSKFCELLFCVELTRRMKDTGVVVNAVHPGNIYTNIANESPLLNRVLFRVLCWLTPRSAMEGAQTPIYLAVAKEMDNVSGKFYSDCKEMPLPRGAKDVRKANELWNLSRKLVGYKDDEETIS
ncbi:retinol dehydrogenase 12-like [Amyelois transitella]|uniref:retinol dehydrogenase 12-like n=1 Tax=Amyelois transitella TaxID=680683 RepID=UPI0029906617|nr:retinol dehydrogenase 12-like [Amyelois transitella]